MRHAGVRRGPLTIRGVQALSLKRDPGLAEATEGQAITPVIVTTAHADGNGRYQLTATPSAQMLAETSRNDGWVNVELTVDSPAGTTSHSFSLGPLPRAGHRVMPVVTSRPVRHVAAAALLLCGLVASACSSGQGDGPLYVPSEDAVVGAQAEPGQLVAYGFNIMTNKGTSPITNISVELVPPADGSTASPDGIAFEPPVVVDIGALGIGYLAGGPWPYEEWGKHAKPLRGYTLAPATDGRVELFVLARVAGDGQWLWPQTRIEYDYEGSHYAEEVTNGFAVCAPTPCTPRTASAEDS